VEHLDSMHARYYAFNLGRFMSVDPVGGTIGLSQSWNRYAYVGGNPITRFDPTGEKLRVLDDDAWDLLQKMLEKDASKVTRDKQGNVTVNATIGASLPYLCVLALRVGGPIGASLPYLCVLALRVGGPGLRQLSP